VGLRGCFVNGVEESDTDGFLDGLVEAGFTVGLLDGLEENGLADGFLDGTDERDGKHRLAIL
jgi:hypothetical protein